MEVVQTWAYQYHTAEIPFVMNSLALTETMHGNGSEAKALADKMSRAWVAFARTGNPNIEGLSQWEAYTPQNGATMIFDNKPVIKYHHDAELLRLLKPDGRF